jgi:beta-RFAP synthase
MIRVQTASRLHFGLLNFGTEKDWRKYGGAGLMVEKPGIILELSPANTWSAAGPLAARALAFARMFLDTLPTDKVQPQYIHIQQAPAEHIGLGTGTQLALAVASALVRLIGMDEMPVAQLAQCLRRGQRSAVGIHGFAQGGFLVDGGKPELESLAPLLARADFPQDWRIVLVMPPWGQGRHGNAENAAFAKLRVTAIPNTTDLLCRLALQGILPALKEGDFQSFGEALFEFNRRVGENFAPIQGGTYSCRQTSELVAWLRRQGIRGAGQSSWGPGVFAVAPDESHAEALAESIPTQFGFHDEVLVTAAQNHGALIARHDYCAQSKKSKAVSKPPHSKLHKKHPGAMTITIQLPAVLRSCCAGASELALTAPSVRAALEQIARSQPELYRSICDETGALRRHINLFVNTAHVRDREGIDTALVPGDVLTIMPAVSGG